MGNSGTVYIHQGLNQLFAAGRSLILVQTFEEDRLQNLLEGLAKHYGKELWVWSVNLGIQRGAETIDQTRHPEDALAWLSNREERPVIWLKDMTRHDRPEVIRGLRDLYYRWRDGGFAVISATSRLIPPDLEREMAWYQLDMPAQVELVAAVKQWSEELGLSIALSDQVISATLKGLTLAEARHALVRLKNDPPPEDRVLAVLQEEKRRLVSKIGTLEYIPRVPKLNELGGLSNLKEWLAQRRDLIVSTDDKDREIVPKGILLMGVSGCGKSLCIKAISSAWQLPLYRIEMTRVFSGAFGSPELAFANACRLMEELAPAVLWIDEIEMGLSAEGSSAADTVLSRIFAFFLTWMQEKPPGLFVAATANRIDLLPAEMIRKGRFDQVFFVDLPTQSEREQIFEIHLKRRGYEPAAFTPEVFADATQGWNGAEIEQCVIAAVTNARMEQRDLQLKDLYATRKQIVPISQTMEEQVRHIRNWAYERAVRASAEE